MLGEDISVCVGGGGLWSDFNVLFLDLHGGNKELFNFLKNRDNSYGIHTFRYFMSIKI